MTSWATSGVVKIERANKHVRDLQAEIEAFFSGDPYTIVRQENPETRELVVLASIPTEPPLRWAAIAGDAIHNLRSALDLVWRQATRPGAHWMSSSEAFKVYGSSDELEAKLVRAVKGRRKAAMSILKAIKSYKGGNYLLWLLDEINNINKHRLLIPAYNSAEAVRFWTDSPQSFPRQVHIQKITPVCPVHDGTELWRTIVPIGEVYVDLEFRFTIAFGEVGIVQGKDIVTTLHQLAGEVEGVAETFLRAGLLT